MCLNNSSGVCVYVWVRILGPLNTSAIMMTRKPHFKRYNLMSSSKYEDAPSEEIGAMWWCEETTNYDFCSAAHYKRQSRLPLLVGVHRLSPIPEELGAMETIREEKNVVMPVLMLDIENCIIDLSVIESLRKGYPKVAKAVEYDFEICDDGLLPLARLEQMMSGDDIRPPISVVKSGRAYKVLDGRHRLARSLILGIEKIAAIVMNDGRDDFLKSGGESNPGPEDQPMIKQKSKALYSKRYGKSSIPQDKTSSSIDKNNIDTTAPNSINGSCDSVHNTSGKRNYRSRKNSKGYRKGNYRKDRIELDIPMVLPKEEFNSKYLAKIIAGTLPPREDLDLRFKAAKLNVVYQCPCGINNYGFPKACGCSYRDQVLAMYNNIVARELQVISAEYPHKDLSDIILEKELVVEEIKSVESAVRTEAFNYKSNVDCLVSQNQTAVVAESQDLVVRKRRGIYRWLKTPGIFNFNDKFNHHHHSITKTKDQSRHNALVISDQHVNDELYNYLRRNEFDTYPDRAAKLAHMTKLAAKWEGANFKLSNQGKNLTPLEINKYFVTIQKVTDAKDTEFLLQEVNAYHSNSRFKRFIGKLGCYPKYLN